MDVENMISKKFKGEGNLYKLISKKEEQNKFLGSINIYAPEFLQQIWNSPKSLATLLLKADKSEVKNYLSHFIVHNLYDNISSLSHKDDQLIYIITILLKEEINILTNTNSSSFTGKLCGILFEEFGKKKEVKSFFKTIIFEMIKKLETTYSSTSVAFEPDEINRKVKRNLEILEKMEKEENYEYNKNQIEKNFNKEISEEKSKYINNKYIYSIVNKDELNKKILEYEDKDMKDFLQNKISECSSSPDRFSNRILLDKIKKEIREGYIINYYQHSLLQLIDIIDTLFDNLIKNSDLLPYSIKCICKIISILIKKKFPEIIKVEQNKVLSNFFFQILFFPILIDPSTSIFINEIIISNSTMEKLQLIMTILSNIVMGKLFERNYYTPFNWYIIEKMPLLIKFFDNICQISLPPFIEKLINDELPDNYEYNYFKENPEENILYRNICYTPNELYSLITNVEKFKDDFSIDKMILDKLIFNMWNVNFFKRCATSECICFNLFYRIWNDSCF